eukprot:Gb_31327 [translate_table: standard]
MILYLLKDKGPSNSKGKLVLKVDYWRVCATSIMTLKHSEPETLQIECGSVAMHRLMAGEKQSQEKKKLKIGQPASSSGRNGQSVPLHIGSFKTKEEDAKWRDIYDILINGFRDQNDIEGICSCPHLKQHFIVEIGKKYNDLMVEQQRKPKSPR